MTDAPERIWARPLGRGREWGDSGPWTTAQPKTPFARPYIRADLARPKVKPLVWDAVRGTDDPDVYAQDVETGIGRYIASSDGSNASFFRVGHGGLHRLKGSLEAAKSAAQADYERRILEALE